MTLNILSKTGWNRLWLVLTIPWICIILWQAATRIPSIDDIERSYRLDLERLSPEAVAERNSRYATHKELQITAEDILRRKQEAESDYKQAIQAFPSRLHSYWLIQGVLLSLPFLLYGALWAGVRIALWVVSGFREGAK